MARAAPKPSFEMRRHDFLRALHELVLPRTYLEIGVGDGRSLALSRARSVAIDPEPRIRYPIEAGVELVRSTSDAFFSAAGALEGLLGPREGLESTGGRDGVPRPPAETHALDLAFIDGMHLVEFALRDLINVERNSTWWTVIVLDDVFPRNDAEAARARHTEAWAGDVFRLHEILLAYRPELIRIPVDVAPTGLLVLLGGDTDSTCLTVHYEQIVAKHTAPDPQHVPASILERRGAYQPEAVLASTVWRVVEMGRKGWVGRAEGLRALESAVSEIRRNSDVADRNRLHHGNERERMLGESAPAERVGRTAGTQ